MPAEIKTRCIDFIQKTLGHEAYVWSQKYHQELGWGERTRELRAVQSGVNELIWPITSRSYSRPYLESVIQNESLSISYALLRRKLIGMGVDFSANVLTLAGGLYLVGAAEWYWGLAAFGASKFLVNAGSHLAMDKINIPA